MTPQPYQNAYDTALAQLTEIAAQFEQLRARKVLIESAIHALQPFFASSEDGAATLGTETENQPVPSEHFAAGPESASEEYSFKDVPSPLPDIAETGGDPFQRRGKSSFRFKGFATQRSF